MVFWNLPLRLDFHNYSLVCGCLPSAALSRFSPTTADRVGAGCWFCRPYQGLSFCSQMHKWARLFPGCLPSIAAGSHKFHRDFCGWMPNWLLKTGTKSRAVLHHLDADVLKAGCFKLLWEFCIEHLPCVLKTYLVVQCTLHFHILSHSLYKINLWNGTDILIIMN